MVEWWMWLVSPFLAGALTVGETIKPAIDIFQIVFWITVAIIIMIVVIVIAWLILRRRKRR